MSVNLELLQGVWTHRWIKWPDDRIDDTTRVFWLQAGQHFGDIRIPADRQSTTTDGFAGILRQTDDAWLWERHFDYRPTGKRDIGRLTFQDSAGRLMLEEGVDEPYSELWQLIDEGDGQPLVAHSKTTPAILIAVGQHFLLARGDTTPSEISHGLRTGPPEHWIISDSTNPEREGQPLLGNWADFPPDL